MNGQAQEVDTFTEESDESTADLNEFQELKEQSPPPAPQWEIPYEPPVQPARDPYDDVPEWVFDENLDLKTYTSGILSEAGARFRQTLAEERLRERVEQTEARAREAYNGENGLPDYRSMVDGFAIPAMRERAELRQLVLSQPDPAAAAWVVGFCVAHPHLIPQVLAKNGRIDASIFRSTSFRPTVGQNGSTRRQPSGRFTASDWENMPVVEFEAELDRFKRE
jgi:hypothetical protein